MRLPLSLTAGLLLLPGILSAQTVQKFDAPTPQGPVEEVSRTRAEIVLNGLWRWQPAAGPTLRQPDASWGLIWVPGAWGTLRWGHYSNTGPGSSVPGLQVLAKGENWSALAEGMRQGWYEREIQVPASWSERELVLRFERLSTDAEVWLDNAHIGRVAWPGGEIVLPTEIADGRSRLLRVLVSAVMTTEEAIDYMGVGQNTATRATIDLRGITGDVVLASRPAGPRLTDVFVKTSVRRSELELDLEVGGAKAGSTLPLSGKILDDTGNELLRFSKDLLLAAKDEHASPASTAVVRGVVLPWKDPVLWDLDHPELLTLELELGTSDQHHVRFGFREFRVDGRNLLLNEVPIRLRPALAGGYVSAPPLEETARAEIRRLKAHGRNIVEVWPEPKLRGTRLQDRVMARVADEEGMLLIIPAVRINEFATGPGYRPIWNTKEGRDAWIPTFREDWRALRNHPSVVVMALSANFGGHQHDQDPRWMGRNAHPESQKAWAGNYRAQEESDKLAAAFDPTRPLLHHQGGRFGSIFTVNNYLNLIPLQERERWLTEWSRTGDMPYLAVEFGTPFNATMLRGRDGFGNSIRTEPFLAEWTAIYFGSDAYALQGEDYLRALKSRFVGPKPERNGEWQSWQGAMELNLSPGFQRLQDLFITRTWRAWRTEGVTGGMIPWDDGYAIERSKGGRIPLAWQPGRRGWYVPEVTQAALAERIEPEAGTLSPAGRALERVNGPTLAWIAGPKEDIHSKDHQVSQSARFERSIALLNDTRGEQPYELTWTARATDGTSLGSGTFKGNLKPAETALVPVSVRTPNVTGGRPMDAEVTLSAAIGSQKHEDRYAFRIYGKDPVSALPEVILHDPEGTSAAALRDAGIRFSAFEENRPLKAGSLLVVGRNGLGGSGLPMDLRRFVKEGGKAVLLAHTPAWASRAWPLRIAPVVARQVYSVSTQPEVAAQLDPDDLRDWSGAGSLVEARPDFSGQAIMPTFGWRWGNEGSVSSMMIEKPHRSGWTPVVEGEWDLAYSPWMELHEGRGRLTWLAFDFEERGTRSEGALRVLRTALRHAVRAVETPRAETAWFSGSPAGEEQLKHIGVRYQVPVGAPAQRGLLIVDFLTPLSDEDLEAYAQGGGTVVMLQQPGSDTPPRLGSKLRLARRFSGGTAPTAHALTRGLSASDLRWRAQQDVRVLDGGVTDLASGLIGLREAGKGRIVFIQFSPLSLNLERSPYLKHTQWRLTRALSQVLANCGATFLADASAFAPEVTRVDLAGPWQVRFTAELPLTTWEKPHQDPGVSSQAAGLLAGGEFGKAQTFEIPAWHPRFDEVSGEAVWQRTVDLPPNWAGKVALLHIPAIKSFDTVSFNGTEIGSTSSNTDPKNPNPWNTPRTYRIPGYLIRHGGNTITIRQFVPDKQGGIHGQRERFYLQLLVPEGERAQPYVDNWSDDPKYGDNPYRYYRW